MPVRCHLYCRHLSLVLHDSGGRGMERMHRLTVQRVQEGECAKWGIQGSALAPAAQVTACAAHALYRMYRRQAV